MTRFVVVEAFGEPARQVRIADSVFAPPKRGEVQVRMRMAPVNPSDLMTIRGIYTKIPTLPFVPGYEGVGVVTAAGPGLLGRVMMGRRVAFLSGDGGSWAETVNLPARQVVPISSTLADEQAASFFVNPVTAYALTRNLLAVPRGEWLVVSAIGSTLGKMVIKLGKKFGFKTLGVVRRADSIDELKRLGANEVVATEQDDWPFRVQKVVGPGGVRFAIDCVGGNVGSALVPLLGPGGRLIVYGTMSGEPLSFSSRVLMGTGSRVEGFWLGNYMMGLSLISKIRLVREVGNLIRSGELASEAGKVFSLEDVSAAIEEAERPGRGGKALLRIDLNINRSR